MADDSDSRKENEDQHICYNFQRKKLECVVCNKTVSIILENYGCTSTHNFISEHKKCGTDLQVLRDN